MTRENKEIIVSDLTQEFKSAQAIIVCDYKGMKVDQLESIRNSARESGTKIRVVKNTLSKIPMKNAGLEEIEMTDTNIVVWGEDQISACKIADKAANEFKENFAIKTGLIEGKVASMETINAMAKLPTRDELIGMLLNVWNAPVQNFTIGMNALAAKLEEEA